VVSRNLYIFNNKRIVLWFYRRVGAYFITGRAQKTHKHVYIVWFCGVQKGERITTTITIEVPFEIVVELLFALYVHGVNGGNRAFL